MTPSAFCLKAAALVGGDRSVQHGDYKANYSAIARLWTAYLHSRYVSDKGRRLPLNLDGEDVANLMEILKIARRLNGTYNLDDYVDGAGYAGLAGALAFQGSSSN